MSEQQYLERPPSRTGVEVETRSLVVVERRTMIGGSLCRWLAGGGPGLEPILTSTIKAVSNDFLDRACAVIFGSGAPAPADDDWLRNELACTRTRRGDVPLVLFADAVETRLAEEAIRKLHLSGYIPTTASLELAGAALRLILTGGCYFPEQCRERETATFSRHPEILSASAPCAALSPREHAVVELLERGLPNKIIAYRLGMSQSTVKAHVHSIIVKLRVRNRTEAAVARHVALDRSSRVSLR